MNNRRGGVTVPLWFAVRYAARRMNAPELDQVIDAHFRVVGEERQALPRRREPVLGAPENVAFFLFVVGLVALSRWAFLAVIG